MRTALLASAMVLGLAAPSFAQGIQGNQGNQANQQEEEGFGPTMTGPQGQQLQGLLRAARPFANGTFMRVKRGPDDEIALHCPPRISLNTCVTGATRLMQNLNNITNGGTNQQGDTNQQQ